MVFVVYRYVLPGIFVAATTLGGTLEQVAQWVDFQGAQDDIYEWNLSGVEAWAHLVVSGLLWLGVPLVLGWRRILRAEVKYEPCGYLSPPGLRPQQACRTSR